jgi:hypothetical protein
MRKKKKKKHGRQIQQNQTKQNRAEGESTDRQTDKP